MKKKLIKNIPLVSIDRENIFLIKKITSSLRDTIINNNLILGNEVTKFEEEFASFCGVSHAIGTGNGFDALYIALKALGIGKNDEVIIPVNSFIASALAVTHCGATPVFIDCCDDNFLLDLNKLPSLITKKTKAIIPVHLHGFPVDMGELLKVTKKNKIFVLEDCAQAHGASINGKRIGNFGDIAAFSFYPTKNLGCLGDGGMITTNNKKLMEKVRAIRNYGSLRNKQFNVIGVNSRLDSLQASILSIKLNYLDRWNNKRSELASIYLEILKDVRELILPISMINHIPVWHLFVIRCVDGSRNKLKQYLYKNKIITGIHYEKTINSTKAYDLKMKFINADRNAKQYLSLPLHPFLKKSEVRSVAMRIKQFYLKKN